MLAPALLVGSARADCLRYEVSVVVEPPPCWLGESIAALDVNDQGDFVGEFSCDVSGIQKPFVVRDGVFTPLELPPGVVQGSAASINNEGRIAGTLGGFGTPFRAFVTGDDDAIIDLGTLEWGTVSAAAALNDAGMVVGYSGDMTNGPMHAVVWQDGVIADVGELLSSRTDSQAADVNDLGDVVGTIYWPAFQWSPFVYHADGSFMELGPLPGGLITSAFALNNVGHVVGASLVSDPLIGARNHAFLWDGQQMADLGTLPGHDSSSAIDINDDGMIVGFADGPGVLAPTAIIWWNGTMYDLNDLLVSDDLPHPLAVARGISDTGLIVADSGLIAVLLSPVQPSPTDLNEDCVTDGADLAVLLGEWGTEGAADFDGSGEVGFADLLYLLGNWS